MIGVAFDVKKRVGTLLLVQLLLLLLDRVIRF